MLVDDLKVAYDYRQAENAHTQFECEEIKINMKVQVIL